MKQFNLNHQKEGKETMKEGKERTIASLPSKRMERGGLSRLTIVFMTLILGLCLLVQTGFGFISIDLGIGTADGVARAQDPTNSSSDGVFQDISGTVLATGLYVYLETFVAGETFGFGPYVAPLILYDSDPRRRNTFDLPFGLIAGFNLSVFSVDAGLGLAYTRGNNYSLRDGGGITGEVRHTTSLHATTSIGFYIQETWGIKFRIHGFVNVTGYNINLDTFIRLESRATYILSVEKRFNYGNW